MQDACSQTGHAVPTLVAPCNASPAACPAARPERARAGSPYDNPKALLEYATIGLFAVDMAFKFRLAFHDEEVLVHDARAIATRYLRCVPYIPRMPCKWCNAGLHAGTH